MHDYRKGCFYDAWSEYYKNDVWLSCFAQCGLSIEFYTTRQRSLDEIFPWDFIDCGVTKDFLRREWEKAMRGETSPNCHVQCKASGASRYGSGLCMENRDGNTMSGISGEGEMA